jgi:hypothetical protein
MDSGYTLINHYQTSRFQLTNHNILITKVYLIILTKDSSLCQIIKDTNLFQITKGFNQCLIIKDFYHLHLVSNFLIVHQIRNVHQLYLVSSFRLAHLISNIHHAPQTSNFHLTNSIYQIFSTLPTKWANTRHILNSNNTKIQTNLMFNKSHFNKYQLNNGLLMKSINQIEFRLNYYRIKKLESYSNLLNMIKVTYLNILMTQISTD